ncbi:MAG: glycosyl hydrolase family 28-related protein, partial [Candidatus Sumerlaeota bacterium]
MASYTVFNVTGYGAIADDGLSDNAAIQAAIDAAEANGSGIVFFPPGRFHLNTNSNVGTTLLVNQDNIVFRGSG